MSEQIIKTEYSEVMQKSYIDYAMSVICVLWEIQWVNITRTATVRFMKRQS